jgi:hypothetical protein
MPYKKEEISMVLRYVVERVDGTAVTHIGAENVSDAQKILLSIPKKYRGSVYPLYTKEVLIISDNQEDV